MIKAGCPKWICKKCRKARERIIKTDLINIKRYDLNKGKSRESVDTNDPHYRPAPFARTGIEGQRVHYTVGWTDCGCNAGWNAGVVLDPFAGSGTTMIVAEKLGRNSIGIELNPEYAKLIQKRFEPYLKQAKLVGETRLDVIYI